MGELELVSIGRLLLAVALGGVVGLERQLHGRPAGLRTHILVCTGSALIMIVTGSLGYDIDPGRAVAGIVTGIGFLGAGVIVKSQEIVRGLTTAACIWYVAGLGIAVGQGLYVIASVGTVVSVAVLTLLAGIAHRVPNVSYHSLQVTGRASAVDPMDAGCRRILADAGYRVVAQSAKLAKEADTATLIFRLRTRNRVHFGDPSRALLQLPEVRDVAWD